jgi:hypothetical protein
VGHRSFTRWIVHEAVYGAFHHNHSALLHGIAIRRIILGPKKILDLGCVSLARQRLGEWLAWAARSRRSSGSRTWPRFVTTMLAISTTSLGSAPRGCSRAGWLMVFRTDSVMAMTSGDTVRTRG